MSPESIDTTEPLDVLEELRAELSLLALLRESLRLTDEVALIPPSELNRITGALREARNATLRRAATLARAYLARLPREEERAPRPPAPAGPGEAALH